MSFNVAGGLLRLSQCFGGANCWHVRRLTMTSSTVWHDTTESRASPLSQPNMKPLFVLLCAFGASYVLYSLFGVEGTLMRSGRTAMSIMLLFTALGHFKFPKGMAEMLPPVMPARAALVYITGFIEIIAAIGLMIPAVQKETAMLLILFFILILPANIYAAINNIDYQKGTKDGPGKSYLWFRVPLQVLFIVWVYWFGYR